MRTELVEIRCEVRKSDEQIIEDAELRLGQGTFAKELQDNLANALTKLMGKTHQDPKAALTSVIAGHLDNMLRAHKIVDYQVDAASLTLNGELTVKVAIQPLEIANFVLTINP